MSKLSIKNRLLFLSATVLIVIFTYSIKIADSAYSSYNNSTKTYNIVELSIKLSTVLHELQKERGVSSGFLGTQGKKFANMLLTQQTQTDKKIKELKEFCEKHSIPEIKLINKIDLDSIKAIRKKISLHSIDTKEVLDFYTLLNKKIIDTISYFSTIPKDAEVKLDFNSFVIFISSKEKAGVERAILSSVFAMDKFTLPLFNKFSSLAAQQQTLLNLFCYTSSKKIQSYFKQIKKDASFLEVQRIRDIAFSKKEKFGVDSVYWFKTITKKIEKFKVLEDKIAKDIIKIAKEKADNASNTLLVLVLVTATILLLTLYMSYFIITGITKSYAELEDTLSILDENIIFSKIDLKWVITDISNAYSAMSEYAKDELIGKSYNVIRHPDMPKNTFEDIYKTVQSGKTWRGRIKNLKKDGGYCWINCSIEPSFDERGNIIFYSATGTEITNKINLEILTKNQEIIIAEKTKLANTQRDKAISSTSAKSEFLANMSHEIRTPLNAILGFVDLLKEEIKDKKLLEYVNIIYSSSGSLLKIIEDILDFSKIESKKLDISKEDFNTAEEFLIITHLFDAKCLQKNITLSLNIDKNMPKNLISDPLRIKQIISNLISNAVKFTPKDKNIIVDINYKDGFLNISVKDEGIGIEKEKLSHIFEAFNQEDSSTTREFGGTGLGLSISSALVKLLGGELKVKSEKDKGSEFYFSLPVSIGKNTEETQEDVNNATFENKTILLVEDNKANQMFMTVVLKKLKLSFNIANDGVQAVNLYKQHHDKYDVILMDENMPNLNGIEATKQILSYEKENSLTHTPIIALTANALKGDRERFLEAGMDEYLTKPLQKEKLQGIFSKFLG